MKRKLIGIIVLISLLFSGCSMRLSAPESLIRPPRPYGGNAGLQEALESVVKGGRFTLKAPMEGEYRSAYILYDIDGDGEEEALAFYRPGSSKNQVKINILDKENGKWVSKFDFAGLGSDVNSVMFGHMNEDNIPEILISWSISGNKEKKMLAVLQCSYDSNHTLRMNMIGKAEYSQMKVADLTSDGIDEILLINKDATGATPSTKAMLYCLNGQMQLEKMGEVKLESNVTSYASIQVDSVKSNGNNPKVFIDGNIGEDSLITEIIYWDEKNQSLRAPLYESQSNQFLSLSRSSRFTCRDINNDGLLEIPVQSPMPGADVLQMDEKEPVLLTSWVRLDEYEWKDLSDSAINAASFYMFLLPAKWAGSVYIQSDPDSRTWTFYRWDHAKKGLGEELLQIATMSQSSWQNSPLENYSVVKTNGNLVYAAKISATTGDMAVTFEEIEANLQIFD